MELTRNRIVFGIARRLALKVFLVAAMVTATVAVHAQGTGYWLGGIGGGWNAFLWCGTSAGNFFTKCPPCPPGQSCPCEACDTSLCDEIADEQCAMRGHD